MVSYVDTRILARKLREIFGSVENWTILRLLLSMNVLKDLEKPFRFRDLILWMRIAKVTPRNFIENKNLQIPGIFPYFLYSRSNFQTSESGSLKNSIIELVSFLRSISEKKIKKSSKIDLENLSKLFETIQKNFLSISNAEEDLENLQNEMSAPIFLANLI